MVALIFSCIELILHRSNGAGLLDDTDTQKILHGIKLHPGYSIWWHHDWPLNNHFYRPLSTLLFQFDQLVYGTNGSGWAWTNCLLVVLSTIALFWFVRELTDQPLATASSTILFCFWQLDWGASISILAVWIAIGTWVIGIFRHSLKISRYVPAGLVWWWLSTEMNGITLLNFRDLGWIPGRTATSMTVFALLSLACFARHCRLSANRNKKPVPTPSPFDIPATKGTVISQVSKQNLLVPIFSLIFLSLSLACYEQAVMVPALLGLTALCWYLRDKKGQWIWGFGFLFILVTYLAIHLTYIPRSESTYYKWQIRTSYTAWMMMQRYLFFPFLTLQAFYMANIGGPLMWLYSTPYYALLNLVSSATAFYESRRKWILIGFGWLGSALAYGPMAWYKDFDHYHYWPMAIRSIGVVYLIWVAAEMTVTAVSPPMIQAPSRQVLATG